MSILVRKGTAGVQRALVAQYNLLRQTVAKAASLFHADATSNGTTGPFEAQTATAATCTTANAADLATSIALANALKALLVTHAGDAVSTLYDNAGAHLVADTTNTPTLVAIAAASNLATVQTLANGIKVFLNAHYTQSGVHVNNDGTNTVATANATDQASSNALLNACKTAYNAHVASAPAGFSLKHVDP